ncbi:MAG TPA: AroM family protein [Methylomirabilota bacterium]|jgi:protein AroM|nr:AroM family protein [Methylomirabilota bacterium]
MATRVGMVTIGQAPRADVVPEMAKLLGSAEIVEGGALDGLSRSEIEPFAPAPGDEILVTRLADGSSVFLGKRRVTPLVQQRIAELEAAGAALTVLLCTGAFHGLEARRPLVEPDKILLGTLRGIRFPGRLGVLTPSPRHVEQTEARWRSHGFDPVVVALSPYEGGHAAEADAVATIADALRAGGAGLVVLDCIGFTGQMRAELQARLGVPMLVANLLVARVVAELIGA